MAILTGITGAVRANIAGFANQSVRAGSGIVAGAVRSIIGLPPEGSVSQQRTLSSLDERMRGGHAILTYPLNVDNDMQQGHYILFEINEIDEGKLARNKREQANINSAYKAMKREARLGDEYEADRFNRQLVDNSILANQQILDFNGAPPPVEIVVSDATSKTSKSILKERLATKKNHTTIALYMPPNVQVTYDIKYADEPISSRAMVGSDFISAFSDGKGNFTTKLAAGLTGATSSLNELMQEAAMGIVDTFAPGGRTLLEIEKGTVITPRMELMFESVGRRSFTYTFNFIPKSEKEAKIIENIIYNFKLYSMPEYTSTSTRREMKIPGTFDIKYYYGSSENSFLNRVATCFLQNVAVEYGADRFTAYKETTGRFGSGAPAQKTKLTLTFGELETLSQDHIKEGF